MFILQLYRICMVHCPIMSSRYHSYHKKRCSKIDLLRQTEVSVSSNDVRTTYAKNRISHPKDLSYTSDRAEKSQVLGVKEAVPRPRKLPLLELRMIALGWRIAKQRTLNAVRFVSYQADFSCCAVFLEEATSNMLC